MEDCIFCKIVAGELPCETVAETEHFLAFLDIRPIAPGHTLIVPKRHSADFLDMPSQLGSELVAFAQRVARAVLAATGADGFNVGLNNGAAAGQVVFHTHYHVIPRSDGDGLQAWPGKEAGDLAALKEKICERYLKSASPSG